MKLQFALLTSLLISCTCLPLCAQDEFILDDLPDHVTASLEARAKWFASLPQGNNPGFNFFLDDLQAWSPGQTVSVAFLGGTTPLHKDIAEATKQITDNCNIKLDFGFNPTTGKYRSWSTSDTTHAAEIRVSFDQNGYFSLLGRDSSNPTIGAPGQAVGGRANQRSLNLGGFDVSRPASWIKTTRHEFLHALAFNHEHQSPMGGCDSQFRWDDEAGYQLTQDANGQYITDPNGKRPGIYTYLSGAPNHWSRVKVDHNLRQAPSGSGTAGTFDRASIMLYRFPALFYVSTPNPCAPLGGGDDLSAGDIAGLQYLYPTTPANIQAIAGRQANVRNVISKAAGIKDDVKLLYANPK